VEGTMELIA